jgi:hypothetical protein
MAQRLRQAVKHGAQLNVLHAAGDDLLSKVNARLIAKPGDWLNGLAQIAKAMQEAGADMGAVPDLLPRLPMSRSVTPRAASPPAC